MNILILTKYFPPEIGAASHLFYELAESLVDKGHEVTVVTGFPTYNVDKDKLDAKYRKSLLLSEEINGVVIKRLREMSLPTEVPFFRGLDHLIIAFVTFLRGLFTGKQDIILFYSPPLTIGLPAYLLSKIKGVPFVVNVQDLFPQNAIDLGILKNKWLIKAFERLENFVYQKASFITVHSSGNKDHILKKGAPSEKVKVIPNWVDTNFIEPGERMNGFRREHGLGENFVVSFAGTMGYSQDLDIVLESAKIVEEKDDILFLLVGEGLEETRLKEKAEELNLEKVKFLPMQPKENYPEVLNASDVSLVTLKKSVETPVVPSKLLSIMASGRPVLASMRLEGDAPKLIEDAKCGICVEAENTQAFTEALLRLYESKRLREQFGTNGRKYVVDNFSRQVCVDKYEKLFAKAVGKH